MLRSISPINHYYETAGSRPIRIMCDDLEFYVCKYYTGAGGAAYNLFNEFLAASFLKIWDLPVPDFELVEIAGKHLGDSGLPFHYFEKPCFGSKYLADSKEVDQVLLGMNPKRFRNQNTAMNFMLIALFDIWLCNEDRHQGNYNLLFDPSGNRFVPIDHVNIFNGLNIDREPYLISENESILSSPLFGHLFYRSLQPKPVDFRLSVQQDFDNYLRKCHENLSHILSRVPSRWQIDIPFVSQRLEFFFSDEWISQCLGLFTSLFHENYKK